MRQISTDVSRLPCQAHPCHTFVNDFPKYSDSPDFGFVQMNEHLTGPGAGAFTKEI